MTEQMTDTEFEAMGRRICSSTASFAFTPDLSLAYAEARRARAGEDEKDKTIKRLIEGLESMLRNPSYCTKDFPEVLLSGCEIGLGEKDIVLESCNDCGGRESCPTRKASDLLAELKAEVTKDTLHKIKDIRNSIGPVSTNSGEQLREVEEGKP